jgi:hypothetical protein
VSKPTVEEFYEARDAIVERGVEKLTSKSSVEMKMRVLAEIAAEIRKLSDEYEEYFND